MSLENLSDLFVHELTDLFDAERQLAQALPLLANAARSDALRQAFTRHHEETQEQIQRLEKIFQALGIRGTGHACKAMQGLLEEARDLLEQDADPEVLDAALIVAAQKVEHYEIAGYGSVRTFARELGYDDAVRLLERTLKEEAETDEKLTQLAERRVNERARTATEAEV